MPTNFQQYCQMLDLRGPRLIVAFVGAPPWWVPPLSRCELRRYDFYDLRPQARLLSDVAYYFVRREGASPVD